MSGRESRANPDLCPTGTSTPHGWPARTRPRKSAARRRLRGRQQGARRIVDKPLQRSPITRCLSLAASTLVDQDLILAHDATPSPCVLAVPHEEGRQLRGRRRGVATTGALMTRLARQAAAGFSGSSRLRPRGLVGGPPRSSGMIIPYISAIFIDMCSMRKGDLGHAAKAIFP
ncbi:MAG: hypothetical protein U5N53_26305 [Mycobacterium sp.]|nr:hypothetical protein [Mycobacterium sp.]